jgi:hypothetical protein
MTKSFKIVIPAPKVRKPVAKKPNVTHKDKKVYNRKKKHKGREDGEGIR